jgi:ferrochelatase
VIEKMEWIKSYPTHPGYVQAMQNCIRDYLNTQNLKEEEVFLFFSAHGLPQKFVNRGDPYEKECHSCYDCIREGFPNALSLLAFQSKFGFGKWLSPYTGELCKRPLEWNQGRKHIVFVPLSFTSDHLETLFEIETLYVSSIREAGLCAYRCPALNRRADWIEALVSLIESKDLFSNQALIRR